MEKKYIGVLDAKRTLVSLPAELDAVAVQRCIEALGRVPAADVVPVVRCKDCKYLYQEDLYEFWCNGFCQPARLVEPDDFCSHGQRRA